MINKIAGAFAALALLLGGVLAGATPAQAVGPDWAAAWVAPSHVAIVETPAMAARRAAIDCPDLYICLWKDINFAGGRWQFHENTVQGWPNWSFSLRSSPPPAGINNTSSSWVNNMGFTMDLYDDDYCNYQQGSHWFRELAVYQVATAQGSDWNDRISALGWVGRSNFNC